MSDTPRTECYVLNPLPQVVSAEWARQLERELNAANDRIQSLIEERDRANRLADWKWNLRGEFESLLGTDNIEKGIKAVKEMKQRIKRLEEAGDAMLRAWLMPEDSMSYSDWVCLSSDAKSGWYKAKKDKP